jgi:RNA polymerase sigma factor (sigma-70 family)
MDFGSILIQVKKGDRAAEKALFEALADRMLFLCLRYVKSRQDAEDLMISGMFKVFSNLVHFKEAHEHGFINWARRIMINECLMHLRKKNCLVLISEPVHEIPEEGIGVLGTTGWSYDTSCLSRSRQGECLEKTGASESRTKSSPGFNLAQVSNKVSPLGGSGAPAPLFFLPVLSTGFSKEPPLHPGYQQFSQK